MSIIRILTITGVAASLSACAVGNHGKTADAVPLTPTERYHVTVAPGQDEIFLAPHRDGLSVRQAAALDNLVDRWRDAGGGEIVVQTPPRDDAVLGVSVSAITTRLEVMGVDSQQIHVIAYEAGQRPGDPIVVGFTRAVAKGPTCGKTWKGFTKSADNQPNSNFGCANTANFAAMIANPADLESPRPTDRSDAARREDVLGKYEKGALTSSAKDAQATGAVATTGQ